MAEPLLRRRNCITACYRPSDETKPHDIAQGAYSDAIDYLRKEFQDDKKKLEFLNENTNINDVRKTVEKARARYSATAVRRKKCIYWLSKFSARIIHYGKVMDALAQHHPEYVALAWGTMKFVFTGILNHAKLVAHFSQALAEVGGALREAQFSAELYQTDQMREAISQLYAHIMLFFQQAVKWYTLGPAGRAISAIINPYELEYKDTIEQIRLCAETVTEIASAASRAEIRDMHITLQIQHKHLQDRDEKLHEMRQELKEMHQKLDNQVSRLLQVGTTQKSITERIDLNVIDMRSRVCSKRFSHSSTGAISSAFRQEDRRTYMETWLSKEGCSLFVVNVGPRAEANAKEFAAEAIQFLQKTEYAVFWNLSQLVSYGNVPSVKDVMKSLIYQALKHDPTLLYSNIDQLNATKFQTNHSEAEWATLLSMTFSRLPKCFIVIEAEDLFREQRHNDEWAKNFVQLFQSLVNNAESAGSLLKILLVNHAPATCPEPTSSQSSQIVSSVQKPNPVPPRLRMRLSKARRDHKWHGLRARF